MLLMVFAVMISTAAMADHIGIYSDETGGTCFLGSGLKTHVTIIEKYSLGSTGCRFSTTMGVNQFFAFNSLYATIGIATSDITVQYGECLSGNIVVGTAVMNLIADKIYIHPAQGQTQVLFSDCLFVNQKATWGAGVVTGSEPGMYQVATEPGTWGRVKSLYR
jgi:hypothetical protein